MNVSLSASCVHPLHWRITGTNVCLACLPAGTTAAQFTDDDAYELHRDNRVTFDREDGTVYQRRSVDGDVVARLLVDIAQICRTPREPSDQAAQIVQLLIFDYEIRARK